MCIGPLSFATTSAARSSSATSCRSVVRPVRSITPGTAAAIFAPGPSRSGPPATTAANPNRSRSGPTSPANRSTGHRFVGQFVPGSSTAYRSGTSAATCRRSRSSVANGNSTGPRPHPSASVTHRYRSIACRSAVPTGTRCV